MQIQDVSEVTHVQTMCPDVEGRPFETGGYRSGRLLSHGLFFNLCLKALAVLLVFFSYAGARAQTTAGSIVGTVTDPSGADVPGAQIKLVNINNSATRITQTNSSGDYTLLQIPPGTYSITVQKSGFRQLTRQPITLQVASTISINLVLQLGAVSQKVVVTGATPLIGTQTASLGEVVGERETTQLPLNGRNAMNLAALAPSVVPQGGALQNPTGINPFSWGNYQIGGGMANQSAEFLDGAPLNTEYTYALALIPTQDSLQEFKVQTNDLPPQFGRFAGGIINFQTKSGTNNLHGNAWEYIRNKVLNANTYFGNQAGLPRPAFTQNQYGANLGGPVFIPHVYDGRDKTFFFVDWEGFALRQGETFTETVPTVAERRGDLSDLGVPIYDPLSTCGIPGGPPCAPGVPQYNRKEFPNANIAGRMNPVAVAWMNAFYPLPNQPGAGLQNNFVHTASVGGNNYQTVVHIDQNVSPKQHISARYTNWMLHNLPINPYGNGICDGQCAEHYTTNNFVIDDSYSFNPTTLLNVNLSYLRFVYRRDPTDSGFRATDIGWPASLQPQMQFPGPPLMVISGYDIDGSINSQGSDSAIRNATDDDRIAASLTKFLGNHTITIGGAYLRATWNYTQNNLSAGLFSFNNSFTSQNPLTGVGGSSLASFLLGYPDSGSAINDLPTAAEQLYPDLYVEDHWRATKRLTLDLGLRWEDNQPFTERHDLQSYFDPKAVSPLLAAAGLSQYKGSVELVASPTRKSRYAFNNALNQFSPRLGLSFAATPTTVVSAGYGIFWVPTVVSNAIGPQGDPINLFTTNYTASVNGGLTPSNSLSDPFPDGGIIAAPGRNPRYHSDLLGSGVTTAFPANPYPYAQQWNVRVQQQIGNTMSLKMAYAAAKGTHLPFWSINFNQLPDADLQKGSALLTQVNNPFYGIVNPAFALGSPTIPAGQLLLKYPQFSAVSSNTADLAGSTYNSLQVTFQKRFPHGGIIAGAYTWSKLLSNTDTLTAWLEPSTASAYGSVQDNNNLRGEKSLSSNDTPQRVVLSYVYDLPVGRGQQFLPDLAGWRQQVMGNWTLSGTTTLMAGFPLGFTTNENLTNSFGGGSRPNYTPGCDKKTHGSAVSRLNEWFNTACFTQPAAFTFGDEPRNDAELRAPGVADWDSSLSKRFQFTKHEGTYIEFRAEVFNLFNRVQFGYPGETQGSGNFGVVSSQLNNPRLLQFSLRLGY